MADELSVDEVLHDLRCLLAYGWGTIEVTVQRHMIECVRLAPVKKRRSDTSQLEKFLLTTLKVAP